MAAVEIIDPGDYGGADPFDTPHASGGLPFETRPLDPEPYEPRYDDIQEIRPAMEQRMSGLDLGGDKRSSSKPRATSKPRRESVGARDNYVYWRLEKEGEDWGAAYRRRLPGSQKEIAKMAKKDTGPVLAETRRMGPLRAQHLQRLIDDANANEKGDAKWEPVFIDSAKFRSKNSSKVECKRMDVILARIIPSAAAAPKARKGSGELVDITIEVKPKDKTDKGEKKDKKSEKDDKDKESKSKDDENDPFGTAPLFHKTGKPMDSQGVMEFHNGGLPDHIPPDRPIGADARETGGKDDNKDKKKKRRGKSRDGGDDVIHVGDGGDPPIDIGAILGDDQPFAVEEGPIAEPGRSRSRRRSAGGRRRSSAGWGRSDPITYPDGHRRAYRDEGGSSYTDDSDESRYGIPHHDEQSSLTSHDTYGSIGRRGSHYEEGGGRPRVYKEHHRGPSRGADRGYYHPHGGVYEKPARARRYSNGAYYASSEPIPEARQIGYGGGEYVRVRDNRDRELTRRRPPPDDYDRPPYYRQERRSGGRGERPILHYPDEMSGRRAERYMDESVMDEELDRREYGIREREARLDAMEEEEELRRRAMMEEDRLREYGGTRDGGGRRYYEDDLRSRGGYSDGRYDQRYDRGYRRGDY